jgi:hypothetical protein
VNWADARNELASILETVAITEPIAASIARVHQTRPKTLAGDLPCIVITSIEKSEERACAIRDRLYNVRLRLLVNDADLYQAHAIIDAFQEAISAAFDANVALNGFASSIQGPTWEEPAHLEEGGMGFNGADGSLLVRLVDAVTYAA